MDKEEMLNQYSVAYKKNGKWYRDTEKHRTIENVNKRLKELKKENKYEDYKIMYRKITYWFDLEEGE